MTTRRTSSSRKSTTRRRTTTRRTTRRRTPTIGATLGAAVGALLVGFVGNLSWPARIALIVLVVVLALGYLLWSRRAAIAADMAASADPAPGPATPADQPPPGATT